eukprot:TRINITY_DN10954_c0_g1_i2.p1 TRINITY_DN10954_c0_g1~~TRINITY_DN10954_c0_g1_i2.p1  ORF type:complete len:1039 (-),score=255.27 TRINITY_DN10954_c0_g1_i2:84-3200(-)
MVHHAAGSAPSPGLDGGAPLSRATRNFGVDFHARGPRHIKTDVEESKKGDLLDHINKSVIGHNVVHNGPYGARQLTYLDYTASGKPLQFIEDYLNTQVLPLYANTHTTSSITGKQTMAYRKEAREIVMRCVRGNAEKDAVLFCGNGSTAGINRMVHYLGLTRPRRPTKRSVIGDKDDEYHNKTFTNDLVRDNDRGPAVEGDCDLLDSHIPPNERPVVFLGAHEHHSNSMPWRESVALVVRIKEDEDGHIDCDDLRQQLEMYKDRPLLVGSFSAASNVTGILEDTDKVTALLHAYNALAFWDYASAAPHVKIDMNPTAYRNDTGTLSVQKDAIFISPHKFVGGPQTPGVLVIKKQILEHCHRPMYPGGGTVFFVTPDDHRFLKNIEEREEGGTPAIVGAIRCGLVFKLKETIGTPLIMEREDAYLQKALDAWTQHPNIEILGQLPEQSKRIAIVSFMIRHRGRYLHYNFVAALLNDLFGIQVRGGCQCSGPYSQKLLGMDDDLARRYEEILLQGHETLRPGYVRLNIPFFLPEKTLDFIIQAVLWIADNGYRMLSDYQMYSESGEWKQVESLKFKERKWLDDCDFMADQYVPPPEGRDLDGDLYMAALPSILEAVAFRRRHRQPGQDTHLPPEAEALRWFVFPHEAVTELEREVLPTGESPFHVLKYGAAAAQTETPSSSGDTGTGASSTAAADVDGDAGKSDPSVNDEDDFLADLYQAGSDDDDDDADVGDGAPVSVPTKSKPPPPSSVRLHGKSKALMKKLSILASQAAADFDMIQEGDRILCGISGGKDSLTMLQVLLQMKHRSKINFEIGCCTIDPETPSFDPSPLKAYMKELGIPYFYESSNIIEQAACNMNMNKESICAYCARMKRGILYSTCRREGYNVLALGQHQDDLAESFVMSAFLNGRIRTMKAHYLNDAEDLRIIRPFVYVREKFTREFAYTFGLPVINENCPACFEEPKEREHIKKLLATEEHRYPHLFASLLQAMQPLLDTDFYAKGHIPYRRGQRQKHTGPETVIGKAGKALLSVADDDDEEEE